MPVHYVVEGERKLVLTTASGILSREEILEHLQAKAKGGLLSSPELFDLRDVTLDLSVADLQMIAEQVRRAMQGNQAGRIAVVTNNSFIAGIAGTYKELTAEDDAPLEVFQHVEDAREWLSQDS